MTRALGILALLFGLALAAPGPVLAQSGETVLVRVGEHAGYHRMVIDWPADVAYRVKERPGQVLVRFARGATLDLSRYRASRPEFIRSIEQVTKDGRLTLRIGIPNGSRAEISTYNNKFILDVYAPVLAAAPQPVAPAPEPAAKPKPFDKPEPATKAAPKHVAPKQVANSEPANSKPAPRPEPKQVAETDYEPSSGETWLSGLSIGPNVSTLGLGGEIGYRFNDFIGLRLGANHLTYDFDDTIAGNDYEFGVDLLSGGGVIDVYPFGSGLRFTGGARYNTSNLGFELESGIGDVTLGNSTFTRSEVGRLDGDVGFRGIAPYAGLGVEGTFLDGHLLIGFDVGVLFQGDPDVDLSANGTLAGDPTLEAALREEEDDIEDGLQVFGLWDFSFYPVVGLSGAFRF